MELSPIVRYLDRELRLASFRDASNNGLQVANSGRVTRVAAGVDASLEFFEAARAAGADLLVCHHGLSWGDSLKRLTGLNYRLVSYLVRHDLALYACHLPLDAHATLGNNAVLARRLGLRKLRPFGVYNEQVIGFAGTLAAPLSRERFLARVARTVAPHPRAMCFGPERIRTVGVVSGGGAAEIPQAAEAGLDAFVSGEPTLHGYNLARQHGVNAVFAGHYATERFGVAAVADRLRRRFGLPGGLIDLAVPY